ncbi:MAG: ATP-binding protein [Roseburia sp.]
MEQAGYAQRLNESLLEIGRRLMERHDGKAEDFGGADEKIAEVRQEAKDAGVFLAFERLCACFALNEYEQVLACLLWYQQQKNGTGVQAETVRRLMQPYVQWRGKGFLAPCFWQEQGEVQLSPGAFAYLEGELPQPVGGMELSLPKTGNCYGGEEFFAAAKKIQQYQEKQWKKEEPWEPLALVLSGEKGSGRHYLVQQLAARQEQCLLYVTPGENKEWMDSSRQNRYINEILLQTELYDALVCVEMGTKTAEALAKQLSGYLPFVILTCESGKEPREDVGYTLLHHRMELPDMELKKQIIADCFGAEEAPVEPLAARQMPLGNYIRYIKSVRAGMVTGIQEPEQENYHTGSIHLNLLPANRTFQELKLPRQQHEQLEKICGIVSARKQVMKEWGFEEKYAYGNGISVLFYGAPGTGKTMAAQVMANALGLPLFRVDLSQVISKYIGETQKNMGRIFEEAEKCDCILMFDEADAIFAKRSDVSDAQDRYSNAETAYLLQRMEQYNGVSILATNFLQNFDEAFRRRITYMLHFPMPDEELRRQLWESVFPESAEVSAEVDAALLAHHFELSGAAIKNVSVHGACCAMAEGSSIGMKHLLDGIRNEYEKSGKNFSPEQKELMNIYQS